VKDKAGRRKARLRRAFLLLLLAVALTATDVPPEEAFDVRLSLLVANRSFNWIGWEAKALLEEADWWLHGRPLSGDEASQKAEVLAFLNRQQQITDLENRIRAEYARSSGSGQASALPPSITPLQQKLEELNRQQQAAAPQVERILAAQISQALAAEGFGRDLVWPPVTFRFNEMPTYLVISPRHEIRLYRGVNLVPDVTEAERTVLEASVEAHLNVSALVDDLGGIGSWPTMVTEVASLSAWLDIIAHEWTHTYLIFHPLGWHYHDSQDLTTMNETVASIVGEEIAERVMARYYPEMLPPPKVTLPPEPGHSKKEDFNQAMRRIRLHVDQLLAEGRVSEAESYMETERQKLVAAGYYLRRLNQAYFAFHGSYATSPASVDPIGPWLRRLRAQCGSLKAFVDRVAQMRSRDDLLRALEE